jgi:pyruvate dehydrogenase E1 component
VGESLQSVFELALESQGPERTAQLLEKLAGQLRSTPRSVGPATTPYVNTIPPENQPEYPGDWRIERRIKSIMRWNAMAMVVKANSTTNVGGHIASFASAATLYEVAFNHFFRGATENFPATSFIFRATPRRACMRGRFLKAGWTSGICKISGRNSPKAAGCRRIRIRI